MAQSSAEIQAELTDLYAARAALAKGQMVEQAGRGMRLMRFAKMTLPELDAYIQRREQDLEQAKAVEAGTPRRRAIGTYF
ncbi:hypothetical protein C8K11_111133 [Novosphingobium sp. GV055]|nr:hypothetical protein C8K11_111133 [Novosphingobium sp. GV055]PUB01410.1 hypothetical protein C8K12_111133 [Novosphingobium sp. GV061]PUB16984.1 hypothetical protein C8K14_111133 [Novosphingobium sp. GV079]PUB40007.1 hypothetical protein C8K10_111133 [Novosphingobium sp. GV027]